MTDEFGTPIPPIEEPAKKSNKTLIIVIVVVVALICCCCVAFIALLWNFGDQILEALDITTWLPGFFLT